MRAKPTPSLEACDGGFLWAASACSSFPSARPTTVFGGSRLGDFPAPEFLFAFPFGLMPLARFSGDTDAMLPVQWDLLHLLHRGAQGAL